MDQSTPPTTISGKVFVVGDNVDTDQIIPAEYLNLVPTIPEEYKLLGTHAMGGLPDGCQPMIEADGVPCAYAIMIGGRNYGCGSSREHAPIALGAAGIKAVVAASYARIFFRNSVATGEIFPLESTLDLSQIFQTGDEATIDLKACTITHLPSGQCYELNPLGAVAPVIEAGGIFRYARSTGMIPND
jgi:3-isopropylmalate/(R)-2-methylmalate dehydratase small subunit